MDHAVITGSARGIGLGLARQFLRSGFKVTISSINPDSLQQALVRLDEEFDDRQFHGFPCDVREPDQVQSLWDAAASHFGPVTIWINNAGISQALETAWEIDPERARAIIDTNITGTINGTRAAIKGMLAQGGGKIFNLEGFGSDGMTMRHMALYGTSKAAVTYFTRSVVKEVKGTKVLVGRLSPGMVVTDLVRANLSGDAAGADQGKKIFNILGDKVETVTPWLVRKMIKVSKNGARIQWLTRKKIFFRFLSAPFRKRDLFND